MKGKCKACDALVVNNPARLEKHLDKDSANEDEGGEHVLQLDSRSLQRHETNNAH